VRYCCGSAHILAQLAVLQGRAVYAFTRTGDARSQQFALSLGARWAGSSLTTAPVPLDAAILFAPDGSLVPRARAASAKGATIVCAGIHMSDIPSFPYRALWGERCVRSVANLTRADGENFLALVAHGEIRTCPAVFQLEQATEALSALREGRIDRAAVLLL
jgi:propanol-preferring alcohol dehydrogenase